MAVEVGVVWVCESCGCPMAASDEAFDPENDPYPVAADYRT